MDISVIISTCNRCGQLNRLFEALAAVKVKTGLEWEVLMIDNASSDDTTDVLYREAEKKRFPLKPLYEAQPGKSNGVNKGIAEARGSLLIFTDDDVEPDSGWLSGYWKAACQYPEFYGFAGRLLPRWDGPIPKWFRLHKDIGVLASLEHRRDLGKKAVPLLKGAVPGGANAALRMSAVKRMGEFRTDLGPGTENPCAEDTEYMCRLLVTGGHFLYVPEALAFHRNDSKRFTRQYALLWAEHAARCEVLSKRPKMKRSILGIPRYLMRQAVERYALWQLCAVGEKRFRKQIRFRQTWGEIKGYRRLKKERK
ncbi:glycosyltransferase [Desulfobacter postgatei]|jgi:GT2 family glycosyltransferase|uniref:glycosyltransferase family 2 protein n=1 Tax=Desulfobacter postgatei TaxID=2293 RepID=UPI002A36199C|nr:glycosyltransferase [Desulfobacter postgatei]MDX9964220.1 glycosyltransferase [Desulfobacter postgatei]